MSKLSKALNKCREVTTSGITFDPKVVQFFLDNPMPDDATLHAFTDKEGIDTHVFETEAYKLASIAAAFVSGGRAIETNHTELKDFAMDQVSMGQEVESEHVNKDADKAIQLFITRRIMMDHGAETKDPKDSKYYYADPKDGTPKVKGEK